jgi:hypothetical protein
MHQTTRFDRFIQSCRPWVLGSGRRSNPRSQDFALRPLIESLEERCLLADWSGDIPNGTVWPAGEVQRIVNDVRVPAGATLTIEPGAIVKFNCCFFATMVVDGTLTADGTAAQPIVFTSDRDDSVGGDTNGDGAATTGFNGSWESIEFTATSTGSVMDNVDVRFGGDEGRGQVFVNGGQLILTNSVLRNSVSSGLRIVSSNPTVTNNTFRDNTGTAVSMDLASNPAISGVTVTNNGTNGLMLDSGPVVGNGFWNDPDIVYVMSGDVTVPAGQTLTVGPGQVVKAACCFFVDLFVEGTLIADGTAAQPIIFTSDRDDTAGGDTNNNADADAGFAGLWERIEFKPTSTGNVMDNVDVRFGGDEGLGAVLVNDSELVLTNSVLRNSSSSGLRIVSSNPTLTNNTFRDNVGAAVSMDLASNPTISGVTLANNSTNGVLLDGGTISANNAWDDPDIVYVLFDDVTVAAGTTLTVAPGQVVKARCCFYVNLFVEGTLNADGTAAQPIIFTSDRDDTAGGDTNNNADADVPFGGLWERIEFAATSTGSVMDNVDVRFGGDEGLGEVFVNGGQLTLTNSVLRNSIGSALRIVSSNPTLTNNTFRDNTGAAVSMDLASNPAISGVTLANNSPNGVLLDGGTINADIAWDDPDIVYVLLDDVTVAAGATLTVAPGQVVKARCCFYIDMFIDGTLIADGTPEQPIIFTGDRDDSAGGDTNNNANADAPIRGLWERIEFGSTSTGNVMDNVDLRFGGDEGFGTVFVNDSELTLTNSVLQESSSAGLRIVKSNPTVTGTSFQNNSGAAISMDMESDPAITGSSPVVATGNLYNGVLLDGGTINADTAWDDPDIVYVLLDDVTVAAGTTLTVAPGQVVKARCCFYLDIFVDGTLIADGTAAQPIIFTGDRDDSAGGDTNNNADGDAGFRGLWERIEFRPTSTGSLLDHVEVRFGGDESLGELLVDGSELTLTNSVLRDSSTHGLLVRTGGVVQSSNNLIIRNNDTGIRVESGSTLTAVNHTIDGNFRGAAADGVGTTVTLTNNLITNHTRSGVFVSGGGTVNASFNDVFNPTATGGNYEGLADQTDANGNISSDPRYVNRENLRYDLLSRSGAIDAGTGAGAPASDFLGNPRFDDPGVANLGQGTPNFVDIGAFERQDVSDPLNLVIESATISAATVEIGDQVTIDWTVRNNQIIAAEGNWTDAVFASADDKWDLGDTLVGTLPHTGGLAPDGTYSGQLPFSVPPKPHGTLFFIIRADSRQSLRESVETDNEAIVNTMLNIPELELDVPFSGQFTAPGQSRYFRVSTLLGRTLQLSLDSAAGFGATSLFVRGNDVPTTNIFDVRSKMPLTPDSAVLVPRAEAETYYILAKSEFGSAAGGAFTLTATAPGFKLSGVTPAMGGNTGSTTIAVRGSDLTPTSRVTLIGANDVAIGADATYFGDPTLLYATFALNGVTPGPYDVRVVSETMHLNADLETEEITNVPVIDGDRTLADAFTVVSGGGPALATQLVLPPRVRIARSFPFQLEVTNTGNNDLATPVLRIGSPNGMPIGTSPFLRATDPSELQVLVLANQAPRTTLAPGERVVITLFGFASSEPSGQVVVQDLSSPGLAIDWDDLEASYRAGRSDAVWLPLWANFKSMVGATWGSFHNVMRLAAQEIGLTQEVQFVSVDAIMLDLFARAELGQSDTSGFLVPATGMIDPEPLPDGSEGRAGLSRAATGPPNPPNLDYCDQFRAEVVIFGSFADAVLASKKLKLSVTAIPGLAAIYGNRVRDMYASYLHSGAPTFREFSSIDDVVLGSSISPQGIGFKESLTTTQTARQVLTSAKKAMVDRMKPGAVFRITPDQLPENEEVLFSLEDLLGPEVLDSAKTAPPGRIHLADKLEYNQDDIPGMLAGGIGKNGKGSDWFGDDRRQITGDVFAKRIVRDGKTTGIRLRSAFEFTVKDTVDFCPGNLSTGAERSITTVMGLLEANGFAHDVGFTVTFSPPTYDALIPASDLPNDFMPDGEPKPLGCKKSSAPRAAIPVPANAPSCDDSNPGEVRVVRSLDPNDIVGPDGFGDQHWVLPDAILPFTIHFENDPRKATAPAQEVFVTHQLDSDLDGTTFRFTSAGWGSNVVTVQAGNEQSFHAEVDSTNEDGSPLSVTVDGSLDLNSGRVSWAFRSLDPETGLLPSDPFAGFLPVNDASHKGEGFVTFQVQPFSNRATGVRMDATASIVFDVNDPLLTNSIFNTIDRGGPTSRVAALPSVTTVRNIPVSWSGGDDTGGSGIAFFDVFASDNGGPFQLWLNDTPATSGAFPATDGHTYGFYSVATDNLGHVQPTPAKAQATTTVDATPPSVDGVETVRDARGKKITQVILAFDEAINVAAAQTLANYGVVFRKGTKVKPVPLAAATWDGDAMEVTLTPVKPLAVKKLAGYTLTVLGAGTLADAAGNAFDGDGDGAPGGDFVLPLAQATPRSARPATLAAVDIVLDSDQSSASLLAADRSTDRFFTATDLLRRKDVDTPELEFDAAP